MKLAPHSPPRRVLLVEDNEPLAAMLAALLERRGWRVDRAASVGDAHGRLEDVPDCVILDLGLPDGTGEQILRRLKHEHPEVRIVVVTGLLDEQRLADVRGLEPAALLHKPVSLNNLLSHLAYDSA
jgi:DNA-binding response OmpR family regulator